MNCQVQPAKKCIHFIGASGFGEHNGLRLAILLLLLLSRLRLGNPPLPFQSKEIVEKNPKYKIWKLWTIGIPFFQFGHVRVLWAEALSIGRGPLLLDTAKRLLQQVSDFLCRSSKVLIQKMAKWADFGRFLWLRWTKVVFRKMSKAWKFSDTIQASYFSISIIEKFKFSISIIYR